MNLSSEQTVSYELFETNQTWLLIWIYLLHGLCPSSCVKNENTMFWNRVGLYPEANKNEFNAYLFGPHKENYWLHLGQTPPVPLVSTDSCWCNSNVRWKLTIFGLKFLFVCIHDLLFDRVGERKPLLLPFEIIKYLWTSKNWNVFYLIYCRQGLLSKFCSCCCFPWAKIDWEAWLYKMKCSISASCVTVGDVKHWFNYLCCIIF